MIDITSNIKMTIAGIALVIILSTVGYIKYLQSSNENKSEEIAKRDTIIRVDKKSDTAHALTAELNVTMAKAKGVDNEVEINTSIGVHRISFE